jgi:hypothetical protein
MTLVDPVDVDSGAKPGIRTTATPVVLGLRTNARPETQQVASGQKLG